MIAISGAAKMPFVALTLNGFLNDLQEEAYNSDNMFNVIVDQDYVTFHDQDSNANDAQEEHAREPLMYVVRLAGSTDDARSSLVKSLQDAEIEFTAGSATIPSAFPSTSPVFAAGLALAVVGVVLWRVSAHRAAMAGHVAAEKGEPEAPGRDPEVLLREVVKPLHVLQAEIDKLGADKITERIDSLLEGYVLPFAEVRRGMIDRFGMTDGAEILVTVAFGERMMNRVWSAAADGYLTEARACYPDVVAAFEEACNLLDQHDS